MRLLTCIIVITLMNCAGVTHAQNTLLLYDTLSPKMDIGCESMEFPEWILDIDCLPMSKEMIHYEKYFGSSIYGIDTTFVDQALIYNFDDNKLIVMTIYQEDIVINLMKNYISVQDKRYKLSKDYCTPIRNERKLSDFVEKFTHLLPDKSILKYLEEW